MSRTEVYEHAKGTYQQAGESDDGMEYLKYSMWYLGNNATVVYIFKNGKLNSVVLDFADKDNYNRIVKKYNRIYGVPVALEGQRIVWESEDGRTAIILNFSEKNMAIGYFDINHSNINY